MGWQWGGMAVFFYNSGSSVITENFLLLTDGTPLLLTDNTGMLLAGT